MQFSSFCNFMDFREQYSRDGSGTMPASERRNFDGPTVDRFEALPRRVRTRIVRRFDNHQVGRRQAVRAVDVLYAEIRRERARD